MTQPNEAFLDAKTPFDGPAYDHERDWERLNRQMRAIYTIMKDGQAYVSISHWGMFPVGPAHPFGVNADGKN